LVKEEIVIEIKNLTKIFNKGKKNEVIAVDNAEFNVNNSEIFGLLGPNGAGKTTTLRIIATILKPTLGTVNVDGSDIIEEANEVRKNIGFLTGETKLYDRLTVKETFTYFGKLYNIEEAKLKKRVEELIFMFELDDKKNKRIAELSDGMKQKVSLGRTIIHNPKNLILDEPLTGLDILARREVTNFIKSAKKQDTCIIFLTHVMSEAEGLCDQIAIINKGKILSVGEKEKLKKEYKCDTLEEVFVQLIWSKDEKSNSRI
jgi:sodium transport system ATP-binding protein